MVRVRVRVRLRLGLGLGLRLGIKDRNDLAPPCFAPTQISSYRKSGLTSLDLGRFGQMKYLGLGLGLGLG